MPGFPVFVNVIWDPTLGYNTHTLWDPALTATPPPGVPKPAAPVPAIEMIATQMWTAGYFLGKNKFTTKTLHLGVPICKGDHDLGPLIPDLTIPPPNIYYAIMWPFSGRKISFKASTLKMEDDPTSCAELLFLPIPMLTCGDPLTLPLSFPIINATHTLTVGMTLMDALLGALNAVLTAAIDAFFEWGVPGIGMWIAGKLGKEVAQEAGQQVAKALLTQALGKLGLSAKDFAKKVVSGVADWALGQAAGDNPAFKVTVGGGILPEVGISLGGTGKEEGRVGTTNVGGVPVSGVYGNTPSDPLNVL